MFIIKVIVGGGVILEVIILRVGSNAEPPSGTRVTSEFSITANPLHNYGGTFTEDALLNG